MYTKGVIGIGRKILPTFILRVLIWCKGILCNVIEFVDGFNCHVKMARRIKILRKSNVSIKVGFLVIYDSVFTLRRVFELMLKDKDFDPVIIVVPDSSRGESFMFEQMQRSYESMRIRYGNRVTCCFRDGEWQRLEGKFDVCYCANPYFGMTRKNYTIEHFARCGVPVFFAKYFYDVATVADKSLYKQTCFSYLWRYYLDRESEFCAFAAYHKMLYWPNSVKVVGHPQTDALADVSIRARERKVVVVALHQSIVADGLLNIGNFDRFQDFILRLPVSYPEIDWIIRPHPQLFRRMVLEGLWTEERRCEYEKSLEAIPNVVYQKGGSYYDAFVNSDALIEDCASFVGEYYLTGKPHCFVMKSEAHMRTQFMEWGQELISHLYHATCEQDIINFIEKIVIGGNDSMKEERDKFAKEKLMYNYPHASEAIVADIKKSLGRAR